MATETLFHRQPSYVPPRFPASPRRLREQRRACEAAPHVLEMLEAHPTPTLLLNGSRQILAANAAAQQLFGGTEALGARSGEALGCVRTGGRRGVCGTTPFCATCGSALALSEAEQSGRAASRDCRLACADKALDLRVSARPLRVGAETTLVCALEDTSDARRREALERIFFHDALNVAGALQGSLALMDVLGPHESADLGQRLGPLADQLVEELQAQRDLLDAERGELVARPVPVTVSALFAHLRALFDARARAAGVELVFEASGDPSVRADVVLLRRVLANLVKNALEASRAGERVRVAFGGPAPTFTVANPAVMPAGVSAQVFQRSFSTKGSHGRGLGTYGAKLLAERYLGGRMAFTSLPERGTLFELRLP